MRQRKPCEHGSARTTDCNQCANARARAWQKRNRRRVKLASKYGITPEQYNDMLAAQDGKCATCGRTQNPLRVDHDHKTGRVRGLLCNKCNVALGMIEDSQTTIKNLLAYFQR